MIEINLIPPSFRKKRKKSFLPGGFNIPIEIIIGSAGGLLILLVFIHVFLLFTNIYKLADHRRLESKWAQLKPDKEKVDAIIGELRSLQSKQKAIEDITASDGILWAQKLNIVSNSLPRGVWLNKVSLEDGMFFIDGSAISKQGNEMFNVHNLASNLKNEANFLDRLTDLELGSIQRRNIKKIEIADFLITTKLK